MPKKPQLLFDLKVAPSRSNDDLASALNILKTPVVQLPVVCFDDIPFILNNYSKRIRFYHSLSFAPSNKFACITGTIVTYGDTYTPQIPVI